MNGALRQNPTIGTAKNKRKFRTFILFTYLASSVMGAMLVINFMFYNGRVTALDYHPAWFLLAAFIPWFYYDAWEHMFKANRKISLFRSKYASSSLRDKQVHEIKEKLERFVIGKQVYLDPELTLRRLAEAISVKPHHLSRVINQEFKISFTDYINLLRLEEATRRLKSPKYNHLKISAISYDCGFNSVPTFNTLFKKVHKVTPSQLRKNFQGLT
ncbi:helix-turn-helix transcriptional regulator [Fulvivirgaceae bacterium BMA12]|uniref:Helix-turn-helix transcriptional regulator n=1 Tax=Agaribacillus aureus TaxID=3051825 RepID=A0ABT8LL24_9BACT|nr:helix-turn-helix transcriptional regulator [Fulvivirgaceae bacterium BMA12]